MYFSYLPMQWGLMSRQDGKFIKKERILRTLVHFTQIHHTCIPVSGDHQSKLTLMSESLRNDGRIWVPKNIEDVKAIREGKLQPTEIAEENRDYYLERRYPAFGNLFLLRSHICLRCGNTRYRYSERRTGYIIQAQLMAESNRAWISTVLTADTILNPFFGAAAFFNGQLH